MPLAFVWFARERMKYPQFHRNMHSLAGKYTRSLEVAFKPEMEKKHHSAINKQNVSTTSCKSKVRVEEREYLTSSPLPEKQPVW